MNRASLSASHRRVLAMRAHLVLFASIGAAALVGCTPPPAPPEQLPPPPSILEFQSSAALVEAGTSVTLQWKTQDATLLELREASKGTVSGVDASQASGDVAVTVGEDSLFILTAQNARGVRDSRAVSIRVKGSAPSVMVVADPPRITAGESATLAWTAFGAHEVWLRDGDGKAISVGTQLETGSIPVSPRVTTHYILTVDDAEYPVDVRVDPSVTAFVATPSWALPGQTLTLSWRTTAAASVRLSLEGQGELLHETDPEKVARGEFQYTVPEKIDPAAVLSFQLRAESTSDQSTGVATIPVYIGGTPLVTAWRVPRYALLGGTFTASWKTVDADQVEILEDDVVIYRSPVDPALAVQGTYEVGTSSADHKYRLRAFRQRGGEAFSLPVTVSPVGLPTVTTFTANPQPGIQQGGEPVTLTWNVPSARNLQIVANGSKVVATAGGLAAESGTVTVNPNVDTDYVLTADNGAADTATASAHVSVATPSTLTFSPSTAPVGSMITLTAQDVPGGTEVRGLPTVVKNMPGEAFVELVNNGGVNINHSGVETAAQTVALSEIFHTTLFGQAVSGNSLSVSMNGWLKFSTSAVNGPDTPTPFPTTALEPLALAPFWDDLAFSGSGTSAILYRFDTVGTDRRLIVEWSAVTDEPHAGSELTFEVQLYSSGKVVFAYDAMSNLSGATPSIGVVNANETAAIIAPDVPVQGDTYTFFDAVSLPASMMVDSQPLAATVVIPPGQSTEIDTTYPVLPAGQFVVSEVNVTPAAGVTNGQWFELENRSSKSIDLSGWTLDFGGGQTHTVTGAAVLPANGHLVFGQSANAGDRVAVDYVYGSTLQLTPGTPMGVKVTGPAYAALTPPVGLASGSSWQTGAVATGITRASGVTAIECAAALTSGYGTTGQRGTPGAANTPCPSYLAPSSIPSNFEPIAATGTPLCAGSSDACVQALTPAVPFQLGQVAVPTLYVNTNGHLASSAYTCTSTTCYDSNPSTPSPTTLPIGTIAPFWDDLVSPSVFWATRDPDGTPGSGDEYTIVSWEHAMRKTASTDDLNFQVKLFANGNIEFHYGAMTGNQGSGATTWLEDPTGRTAWIFNLNTNTNPGIAANSAVRFTLQ